MDERKHGWRIAAAYFAVSFALSIATVGQAAAVESIVPDAPYTVVYSAAYIDGGTFVIVLEGASGKRLSLYHQSKLKNPDGWNLSVIRERKLMEPLNARDRKALVPGIEALEERIRASGLTVAEKDKHPEPNQQREHILAILKGLKRLCD